MATNTTPRSTKEISTSISTTLNKDESILEEPIAANESSYNTSSESKISEDQSFEAENNQNSSVNTSY
jgi:hypothetical protein